MSNQDALLQAVHSASAGWVESFNAQDAAGCAAAYEPDAVMVAKPFGTFRGRTAIEAFWRKLHDDGFRDVQYIDPQIEVVDATSALVTARWRMNQAHGVITKELWVLQPDGRALLREDEFEALGSTPEADDTPPQRPLRQGQQAPALDALPSGRSLLVFYRGHW